MLPHSTPRPPTPGHSGRLLEPDFWRGVALLLILIRHLPSSPLELISLGRYGISDSAAWFFLISGFITQLVYSKQLERTGLSQCGLRICQRVLQLAGAQFLLASVFVAYCLGSDRFSDTWSKIDDLSLTCSLIENRLHEVPLRILCNDLHFFCGDILPAYMICMVAFGLFLFLKQRWGVPMLLGSGLLYMLNLVGILALHSPWSFNPFAWQFIFVIGAWLHANKNQLVSRPRTPPLLLLAAWATLALCSLGYLRYPSLYRRTTEVFTSLGLANDKNNLGPLYLGHALLLAYVLLNTVPITRLSRLPGFGIICQLGQASLPVFVIFTLTDYTAYALHGQTMGLLPSITCATTGILVSLLFIRWQNARKTNNKKAAATEAPLQLARIQDCEAGPSTEKDSTQRRDNSNLAKL